MVSSISTDRRGIYKDLYREIDADNNKKKKNDEVQQSIRPRKGIYADLYRQLDNDKLVNFNAQKKENKEDIWHTYPLKTMVYSNDIGEALRPIIGGLLAKLSWLPTIIYALIAVLSKGLNPQNNKKGEVSREVLFQLFASFLLPLILVKSVGKVTNKVINKLSTNTKDSIKGYIKQRAWLQRLFKKSESKKASGYRNVCVTTAGVFALAVAVRPIDNFVDKSLDKIYNRG